MKKAQKNNSNRSRKSSLGLSDIQPPRVAEMSRAYFDHYVINSNYSPEHWCTFLNECGVQHVSMDRLIVVDKQKYFLSKIKYGIG